MNKSVKTVLERRGFKNFKEKGKKEEKEERERSFDLKELRKLVTMRKSEVRKKREVSEYKRRELKITRPLLKRCWKQSENYIKEEVAVTGKQMESQKRESRSKYDEAKREIFRKKRKDLEKLLESIEVQEKKETTIQGPTIRGSAQKLKESVELDRQISEEIMLQQRLQSEKEKVKTLVEERKISGSAPVGKKRVIVFTSGLRQTESITPMGEEL